MSSQMNLFTDGEDALRTLSSAIQRSVSRRSFLRRSMIGAAMVAPVGLLAACGGSSTGGGTATAPATSAPATSAPASPTTGAAGLASLTAVADNKTAFTEIQKDENDHVMFLQGALKTGARPKPTFKGLEQADVMAFAKVSQILEGVGVGAYLMAAPAVTDKKILAAAGSILTVESRHAGFLNALLAMPISPSGAFDKPLTQAEIVKDASPFIMSLNGGPDPSAPLMNDTEILNFALLLEFLEAEFYNLNVPKFFK